MSIPGNPGPRGPAPKRGLRDVVATPVRRLLDIAGVSSWFDVLAQASRTRCPFCEARVLATAFECPNCGHDFVRT